MTPDADGPTLNPTAEGFGEDVLVQWAGKSARIKWGDDGSQTLDFDPDAWVWRVNGREIVDGEDCRVGIRS